MKTQNVEALQIHKLTQEQYDRTLAEGRLDATAFYLTPDPPDVSMTRNAATYPYTEGDNDESRFEAWLDEILATMAAGEIRPIRFSVYPAISGTTNSGFLYNHRQGYAEVLTTTYGPEILHKYRSGNTNGWQPTLRMGLVKGTPALANHNHDERYYQPGGATVLTNQNWNQYISTSGGGSAGMVREFDSGYLWSNDAKATKFTHNGIASKMYMIAISTDTMYKPDGTEENPAKTTQNTGTTYTASVDYMTLKRMADNGAGDLIAIQTDAGKRLVRVTISGSSVTFEIVSGARFVNICGYY